MASSSKHGVKLSEAQTRYLIELYRSHDVLWNSQITDYKNQHARDKALQCIQTDFEAKFGSRLEVAVIKTKIQSFRNSFSKEFSLLKVSARRGAGTKLNDLHQPRYPYFIDLLFLEPVLKKRPSTTNLDDTWPGNQNVKDDSTEDELSQTILARTNKVEPEEDGGDESVSSQSHASSPSVASACACETPRVSQEASVQGEPPAAGTSTLGPKKGLGKRKTDSQEVELLAKIHSVLQRRCSETGGKPDAMTTWAQNLGNELSQIKDPKKRRRLQIEITRKVQDALAEDLDNSD